MTKDIKGLQQLIEVVYKASREPNSDQASTNAFEHSLYDLQKRHYTLTGKYHHPKKERSLNETNDI